MNREHGARSMMERTHMDDPAIALFERQVAEVRSGTAGALSDREISPYSAVSLEVDAVHRDALDGVAVIRLNGGLGTSMGLDRAKSLLDVRDGLTFLDVIARQILALRSETGTALPITFLQSFRTSAECLQALTAYARLQIDGVPIELLQHRVPKLRADDLTPVRWPDDPELEWCPPGHGDLYSVLHTSGFLDQLTARGIERVFVANCDNLGAVPDAEIASWFAKSGAPLAIEAVRRHASDRKGGHFAIRNSDGRLVLRETAQTPPDELAGIGRHPFASTNNLWFDVAAMKDALRRRNGDLGLPVIVNHKTVDPTKPNSPAVVQLETAMGAAVEVFDDAVAVEVSRDRFIPVKSTDDLLVVRSDCYELTEACRLQRSCSNVPFVALGPTYRLIDDFEARFPSGPPSLIDARSLVVHGDWTFGDGVQVVGDVELGGRGGHVPDGEILENVRR